MLHAGLTGQGAWKIIVGCQLPAPRGKADSGSIFNFRFKNIDLKT